MVLWVNKRVLSSELFFGLRGLKRVQLFLPDERDSALGVLSDYR